MRFSCERRPIPGGALHIFRVRGRAIGKGIYFLNIGIKTPWVPEPQNLHERVPRVV